MKKIIILALLIVTTLSLFVLLSYARSLVTYATYSDEEVLNVNLMDLANDTTETTSNKRYASSKIYFIHNGQTEYKVLYDMSGSSQTTMAASELVDLIYTGCGIILDVVDSSTITEFKESDKYIVIGTNEYSKSAGVEVDVEKVGSNGFHIETKGSSIFLLGGGDWGNIWAAYDFLEAQIGYKCYYYDELKFDEALCENSTLVELNYDERPSWEWRCIGDGEGTNNKTARTRLRMHEVFDAWAMTASISFGHTYFTQTGVDTYGFVPLSDCLYGSNAHRNWYNLDYEGAGSYPTSLCFSRDPEGLADQCVKKALTLVEANPGIKAINFSQLDNPNWCYCDKCRATQDKYGSTNSSTVVIFMRLFGEKFKKACAEKGYPTDIILYIYAYWNTLEPPHFNDSQINELKMPDNVGVQFCPLASSFKFGITEKENATSLYYMEQWSKICSNFALYDYEANFGDYLSAFDGWNKIADDIIYYYNKGGTIYYNLMNYQNIANPNWTRLHMYVEANLTWDVTIDVNALVDDFFENYYYEAADIMKEWYYIFRVYSTLNDHSSSIPVNQLQEYLRYADLAFDAILKYKYSDPELYEKLYDRINLETITARYMMLCNYRNYIGSTSEIEEYATLFKADCAKLGVQMARESYALDSKLASLGY